MPVSDALHHRSRPPDDGLLAPLVRRGLLVGQLQPLDTCRLRKLLVFYRIYIYPGGQAHFMVSIDIESHSVQRPNPSAVAYLHPATCSPRP